MIGEVQRIVEYVDYCCANKVLLVEIINITIQLKINMDSCSFWWLDLKNDHYELVEIATDPDALLIASTVDYAGVIYMYARGSKADANASISNVVVSPLGVVLGMVVMVLMMGVWLWGKERFV